MNLNIMERTIFASVLLFISAVHGRGLTVDDSFGNGFISLYMDSEVVDMYDTNTSMLYDSESLWIVQFYSHWCGHCQRFAPIWKDLANSISSWSPVVRVAAMNCADQSCDRYQIRGTPTVRIFHPMTAPNSLDSSYYGYNVPVKSDQDFLQDIILYNLAVAASKGAGSALDLNTLRSAPYPEKKDLSEMFDSLPQTTNHVALIFEQEGKNSIGKKVILDMNQHSDVLAVMRVNFHDPAAREWKLYTNPSLVVVDRDGSVLERVDGWGINVDRNRFTKILTSYAEGNSGQTEHPEQRVTSPTTAAYTVPDKVYPTVKDEVFMSDLEKAVEYSIKKEVAMQPVLDQMKLQTLVYYIETLLNFFPNMRTPIRKFLISLREWPVQMRLSAISHTDYKAKVNELSEFYQPFLETPLDWKGCAGSNPQFRGYPCSLWTLFHTLTENAAAKDPAFHFGGVSTVANAMIGYVRNFFSCRECAEHFNSHVSRLGYLPHTGDQSILWMWTIHNTANHMLAGDQTEDPTRPKIQWPSAANCPNCRSSGNRWTPLMKVNEELWNQGEVLSYLKNVYNEENIVQNVKNVPTEDKIEEIISNLKKETKTDKKRLFDEALDKIMGYCRK